VQGLNQKPALFNHPLEDMKMNLEEEVIQLREEVEKLKNDLRIRTKSEDVLIRGLKNLQGQIVLLAQLHGVDLEKPLDDSELPYVEAK
jgi:hypothetical protein